VVDEVKHLVEDFLMLTTTSKSWTFEFSVTRGYRPQIVLFSSLSILSTPSYILPPKLHKNAKHGAQLRGVGHASTKLSKNESESAAEQRMNPIT